STVADPNNTNNSSTVSTNVGPQADLAITKTGPTSANTGQNVTYTVTVTNNGPSTATGVVVGDPTPNGISFQSNTGACATAYPCNPATLNSNQSATITATFTIPPTFSGSSVTNTTNVSSSVGDPNATNNTAAFTTTVTSLGSDLAIAKSGPTFAVTGQNITYT